MMPDERYLKRGEKKVEPRIGPRFHETGQVRVRFRCAGDDDRFWRNVKVRVPGIYLICARCFLALLRISQVDAVRLPAKLVPGDSRNALMSVYKYILRKIAWKRINLP